MATSDEPLNFSVSEDDLVEATKAALGPDAVIESYESNLIQEPGVGFLAVHFIINVRARSSPGQPIVELPMFAKLLPPVIGPAHYLKAFATESAFLRKLQMPLHEAFKSPDGNEGPKWLPRCYLAREDIIIAENMGAHGYKGTEIQLELPIEYVRVICQALARFHAAGLMLAHKHGREAAVEICPELEDNILYSNDWNFAGVTSRNASIDSLAAILCLMLRPEELPRLKELQERLIEMGRGMHDAFSATQIGPLVPLHGDCHKNNFLYKYDDQGNPIDAVIIDFQLVRFHVPAFDILFMVYLSLSLEDATNHLDEFLQFYYENLRKETARCGVEIETILTFEDLLAGAERIRSLALLYALQYSTVLYAPRMELGKVMMDPFNYRRYLLHCRGAEALRWFREVPHYRARVEVMLRKVLEL